MADRKQQAERGPFRGTLQELRLISSRCSENFRPGPGEEVEQHLRLTARGDAEVSGYALGEGEKADRILTTRKFTLEKHTLGLIFAAVEGCFRMGWVQEPAAGSPFWQLELTSQEGRTFVFRGSLGESPEFRGVNLSDLIRNGLGLEDLTVFDSTGHQDKILSVIVDYRRVMKVEGVEAEPILWDYSEQVVLDRATETVRLSQHAGAGCHVNHSYQVDGGVSAMLDSMDPQGIFSQLPPQPSDLVALRHESRSYRITVKLQKGRDRVIMGSYDHYGLPEDYGAFAQRVAEFIQFFGTCEMLAPAAYDLRRRRRSDYIFCSVEFPGSSQRYYYLADEDIYAVGDQVVVPAGREDQSHLVTIVDIQYFPEEEVPMPLNQVKHILGKRETT